MATKDIIIPLFDGEEYGSWRKRMLMFLKMKKCDVVITRNRRENENVNDWEDKELKAINYIYSAITNKQLDFVSDKETAMEIINKFDELYLKESTALQIVCRNKLDRLRLKEYSETSEFFSDFEKAVNELKAAGAKVTEKEKMNYMLRMLPETHSYIGDLVDVLREEDQTVEYIKNKIKMMEVKHKDECVSETPHSNVYKSETVNNKCYACGKFGHFKKNCKAVISRSSNNRGNFNHRRGQGQGIQRGRRGGHYQRSYYSQDQSSSNFNVEIKGKNLNVNVASKGNAKEIIWLLDSGCTDHVINNDIYFSECDVLKHPVDVRVGDGRKLKATKVGKVVSYFDVFGRSEKIVINNVYYVKEMDKNLISFAKITENNNRIISMGNTAKIYNQNNRLIAIAWKENNLYKM